MQVVGGADADILDSVFIRSSAEFFKVPVKSFNLGKKTDIK
jgi:hypothetical protein